MPLCAVANEVRDPMLTNTGLPSGQKVRVRLRACKARGKSNWSDPACKRVP
jgi:hypothetical protein